jgi:metallo-beta-lactamase class B
MKHTAGVLAAMSLFCLISATALVAQGASAADAHFAKAMQAAQRDYTEIFDTSCGYIRPTMVFNKTPAAASVANDPKTWHAEPVKVFDNLYFVGQSEYSAWAVTTSAGIIVMDAIFDYSVEDEVINGLTKLGLDPKQIKYVIVSHAHGDHVGGARALQDRGAKIVMSAADWDLMERSNVNFAKPKRDVVATDGQKLTLGDTTLTMYITPGHTLGTISTLIPVKDRGTTHMAAYWGGTAFNWVRGPAAYITPERPATFWFQTYAASAQRFRDIVMKANADVILSNHTKYDSTPAKTRALASRGPKAPNPYVVGTASVERFLTVAQECALAGAASSVSTK